MEKPNLQQEWEVRIAEYKTSGKTQIKWCEENHLKIHQFKYWLYKIERSKITSTSIPTSNWVSVALEENIQDQDETIEIKVGKASIEVKPGFDSTFLADVVRTLTTLC